MYYYVVYWKPVFQLVIFDGGCIDLWYYEEWRILRVFKKSVPTFFYLRGGEVSTSSAPVPITWRYTQNITLKVLSPPFPLIPREVRSLWGNLFIQLPRAAGGRQNSQLTVKGGGRLGYRLSVLRDVTGRTLLPWRLLPRHQVLQW